MSGGKGGDDGGSKSTTTIKQSKPSPVVLPEGPFSGLGFNLPANPGQMGTPATGQGLTPPAWAAQGSPFAMDWWGQQAPNVGAALLQQEKWGPWAPASAPGTDGTGGTGGTTGPCPAGQRMGRGGTCVPVSGGSRGSKSSGKSPVTGYQSSGGKSPGAYCSPDDIPCQMRQMQYQIDSLSGQNWASHGTQG